MTTPRTFPRFGLHDAHYELTLHATPTPPTSSPAEAAAKPEESEMKVQPGVKTRYRFKVGGPTDLSMEKFFATLVRESDDAGAQGIVVFEVSSSDVEKLRKTVDDLRDRRLINVKASSVSALKFTPDKGEPVLVARSPDGWVYGSPQPAYEVDKMVVLRVLDRWMSARATAFASAVDVATGQPAYTLELSIENQPQPMVLKVFAAAKDDHWWGGARR
ncbi:MAG: DUF4340 domain-containing protein [Phycisphaerales bacterium]|nr:DUF4340 domain-containing protein [Phycisphaerales bacterium]